MEKDNSDYTWAHLAESHSDDFVQIEEADAESRYEIIVKTSHGMIYALDEDMIFELHKKALVLMQLRCDGFLGFSGGIVDEGETPLQGLNRECVEEINLRGKYHFEDQHLHFTFYNARNKHLSYFYAMRVSKEDFFQIEREATSSAEFGIEVFGLLRVPLFTMHDGFRGFPAFLGNKFIGSARIQLLRMLSHLHILTEDEILQACKKSDEEEKKVKG